MTWAPAAGVSQDGSGQLAQGRVRAGGDAMGHAQRVPLAEIACITRTSCTLSQASRKSSFRLTQPDSEADKQADNF